MTSQEKTINLRYIFLTYKPGGGEPINTLTTFLCMYWYVSIFQKSNFDHNTCNVPKRPNNGFRWCPLGKLSHLGLEQLTSIEARTALSLEAHTKVQNGFAKILKYKTIKDRLPSTLKVYLAACIPHKRRQYRVILDLYFRLCVNGKYLSLVNDVAVKKSPQ